ncbi:hypothetical protein P4V15_04385 [Bacillus subtilis]|nr:hypothetical protein [Bacillus subtilis]
MYMHFESAQDDPITFARKSSCRIRSIIRIDR